MPNYTLNLPQGTQTLAQTQQPINDNFAVINTTIATNHVALTDGTAANRGKHNLVVMPVQAAGPVTGATETAVYTKSLGGTPTVYLRQNNSGSEIQISGKTPASTLLGATEFKASTYLPGGLLLQYGWRKCATGASTHVAFQNNFSAAPLSIVLTLTKTASGTAQAANVVAGTEAVNGFDIWQSSSGTHFVYWQAIGLQ